MRILDLFKLDRLRRPKTLELDEETIGSWPQQIVAHLALDEEFTRFNADIKELAEETAGSLRKFSDEDLLSAIPERARTMNALHGNEYATQAQKLLKTLNFTDLFSFERQQDAFFEATGAFKDQTAKNVSVLKEFMSDELKESQSLLQRIEDRVIGFSKLLEERKFPVVRKMREQQLKITQMDERAGKYRQLLANLEADLKRTQEKRVKLEGEIKEQLGLIRNQESLGALERIRKIDEDLHKLSVQYAAVCADAKALYKKHPEYSMAPAIKHVLDELPKDPVPFLSAEAESAKSAFEEIIAQLEEERPGNTSALIQRLSRLAGTVETDARTMQTLVPDQRRLKRDMMKDVAALATYDKRQFLLRAQTEEETLQSKIAFLNAELDPQKRLAIQREVKDLAHQLGAQLRHTEPQATAPQAAPAEPEAGEPHVEEDEPLVETPKRP